MEIQKFEIEFVRRSKSLLENYHGPYDMSNLINCTLGLIMLPYEEIKVNPDSFWTTEISKINDLLLYQLRIFEPIQKIKKSKISYYPKTLKVLLQKIRNGLAHQNIEPINQKGEFAGVIIRNYFDDAKVHNDLEIHFSQHELREFALFIADKYLK